MQYILIKKSLASIFLIFGLFLPNRCNGSSEYKKMYIPIIIRNTTGDSCNVIIKGHSEHKYIFYSDKINFKENSFVLQAYEEKKVVIQDVVTKKRTLANIYEYFPYIEIEAILKSSGAFAITKNDKEEIDDWLDVSRSMWNITYDSWNDGSITIYREDKPF